MSIMITADSAGVNDKHLMLIFKIINNVFIIDASDNGRGRGEGRRRSYFNEETS